MGDATCLFTRRNRATQQLEHQAIFSIGNACRHLSRAVVASSFRTVPRSDTVNCLLFKRVLTEVSAFSNKGESCISHRNSNRRCLRFIGNKTFLCYVCSVRLMRLKYSFILLQRDCICETPDSSVSIVDWLGVGRLEDRNSILGKEKFSLLHGAKTGTGDSVP
jgi:hypothetical protein